MKDTYAILKISGLQYLVREGDIVDIKKSKELRPEVLLLSEEGKITIGMPIIEGAKIDIDVEKEFNDKVEVRRFRAKSRHRVTKGFKYPMQRLVIKGINKKAKTEKVEKEVKAITKAKTASKTQRVPKSKATSDVAKRFEARISPERVERVEGTRQVWLKGKVTSLLLSKYGTQKGHRIKSNTKIE